MSKLFYPPITKEYMREIMSEQITAEYIFVGQRHYIDGSESRIHLCVLYHKQDNKFLYFEDDDYGSDYTCIAQAYPEKSLTFSKRPSRLNNKAALILSDRHKKSYGDVTSFI